MLIMDEKDNYLVRHWIGLDTDHDRRPWPKTWGFLYLNHHD
jgi:hypothetical protein